MTYTYEHPKADHTVDAVVFGADLDSASLKLLLVERDIDPFKGMWALPGGFIHMDESLDTAVVRELKEETGVVASYLEQLCTFGAPDRDPRGRVISTAYLGLVRTSQVELAGGTDARAARWYPVHRLPKLAFDHKEIVMTGLTRLRSKLPWQPVGIELLPKTFTLTELQRIYEIILGHELDKRNFRRKVLSFDVLKSTGETRSGGRRPAQLFMFDRGRYKALQKTGADFEVKA